MMSRQPAGLWPHSPHDLRRTELIDPGYPFAGASAWLPHGFDLVDRVLTRFSDLFRTAGYEEILLPTLVNEEILERQAESIKDFRRQLYFVGSEDSRQVVASSIEAQVCGLFAGWVAQGRTPPYRVFCVRTVGRHETSTPRPLWKERFVWPFFEAQVAVPPGSRPGGHGGADGFVSDLDFLVRGPQQVCLDIGLPTFAVERIYDSTAPKLYADRRLELVTILPNGEITILTSVYDLGVRFSDTFGVRYDGASMPMLNFAFSARLVLALLQHSGTVTGPRFHPDIAPIQVGVIATRSDDEDVASGIVRDLLAHGVRACAFVTGSGVGRRCATARELGIPVLLQVSSAERAPLGSWVRLISGERPREQDRPTPLGGAVALARETLRVEASRNGAVRSAGREPSPADPPSAALMGDGDLAELVGLCHRSSCVDETLRRARRDVIGRPYRWGVDTRRCAVCGVETEAAVMLGRKIRGEK
ncbi:prolyl-tRNA synthetase-like protein [Streptosporangium roseum]|uniref:Prolyl-tRNA synthetase-like protein n=2 Tax=Streptosporangium roseum TaxID=2001 RepID=D2AZV7_STRRD|nr:prolyl-tRNA synthetase-like protein [Streptosporangium roseum]ACZ87191.1 Prolyl-tRNA synthetase-like protein [Streptosporangium roseum DSM 43021]